MGKVGSLPSLSLLAGSASQFSGSVNQERPQKSAKGAKKEQSNFATFLCLLPFGGLTALSLP